MTATPSRYTLEQQHLLELNERFIPAAIFDDGDILILEDAGPLGGMYEGEHIAKYLSWVLTRDGKIHGVSHHFATYHDLSIPPTHPPPLEPEPDLESQALELLTLDAAAVYLEVAYGIRVSTRTLRNWCKSGRIASRRFSDRSGSPWHTTRRDLDQVAERRLAVVAVTGPGSADPDPEEDTA